MDTRRLNVLFFVFHSQFQNNNNYMNMAEANGALLAAGDVSILFSMLKLLFDQAKILPDSKCSQAEWRKCTFNISILVL